MGAEDDRGRAGPDGPDATPGSAVAGPGRDGPAHALWGGDMPPAWGEWLSACCARCRHWQAGACTKHGVLTHSLEVCDVGDYALPHVALLRILHKTERGVV